MIWTPEKGECGGEGKRKNIATPSAFGAPAKKPALSAPTDVPTTKSGCTPAANRTSSMPTCIAPRLPPPANTVLDGAQGASGEARLTYAPILTEDSLLHIGGSVRYEKPNDATAASDDRVLQPGGTLRMDANIVGDTLLGTQPLTCVAATAQLVGQNCVKDVLGYGAELVGSYGPFSVQAAYLGMHYDRDAGLLAFFNSGVG